MTVIIVKQLRMTCSACPSQWEGVTSEGQNLYVRYRWGGWRIDLDGKTADPRATVSTGRVDGKTS